MNVSLTREMSKGKKSFNCQIPCSSVSANNLEGKKLHKCELFFCVISFHHIFIELKFVSNIDNEAAENVLSRLDVMVHFKDGFPSSTGNLR